LEEGHIQSGPPKNVILVGTKLDIVKKDPSKRAVTSEEALALAKKLNLYSFIETSAQDQVQEIDDTFGMCAINCYDIMYAK
jgi:hypothetical protein